MSLDAILSVLNNYSEALTIISSLLLAIITAIYVLLTWKLVRVNSEMLKKQMKPNIVLYVQPREEWVNWLELIVENKGSGAAYNVKFELNGDLKMIKTTDNKWLRLSDLGFIKKGIPYFAPGQKIITFLTDMTQDFEEKIKQRPIELKIKYKTEYGENEERKYTIDLSIFERILQVETPLDKIAKNLEELKYELLHVIMNLSKEQKDKI